MGSKALSEISPYTPLGCILKHWKKFGGDTLTKEKLL